MIKENHTISNRIQGNTRKSNKNQKKGKAIRSFKIPVGTREATINSIEVENQNINFYSKNSQDYMIR